MSSTSKSKQMSVNLIAAIVSFAVNAGINFFLSPYIVRSFGTDAYGFIGLANNFIQYAGIITAALNSMSGRFISVAYHRGDKKKASVIFSSVLVADLIIAGVLLLISGVFVLYMDLILKIPNHLITSVKLTFALTFLTFVISVITAVFTTAAYVKNRIDINSIRDIISNLLKVGLIVVLFNVLKPKLYFVAAASLACGVFLLISNLSIKKKILPDVKVKITDFNASVLRTILASGVWMSLTSLSNVLITGLDLLICNIMLGAYLMGILSISKTIPNCLNGLIFTLGNVFSPHYTILYAKGKHEELIREVKFTSKIISWLMTVPITGFIVFGASFYSLWQPTKTPQEIGMIQTLSILTCLMMLFSSHTQGLMMLYNTCNRMKMPVIMNLLIGTVSTLAVILLLDFGNLGDKGVYFIAGISSILMCIKSAVFMPIYSAHIMGKKWNLFFDLILYGVLAMLVCTGVFIAVNHFVTIDSWRSLIGICLSSGAVAYAISFAIIFTKKEKKQMLGFLKKRS
ncbi:MAG: lipopolysaccharide biosynthesis protein [Oscillospiraceae bacterium]